MIRRFAIASLLTIAGAAGLSSASFAQTVNGEGAVDFTASNDKVCVVTPVTPVALTKNGSPLVTSLSGSGSVTARCNSVGNATSTIAQTGGVDVTETDTTTQNQTVPGTGAATTIPISMTAVPANGAAVIPADPNYKFTITVTVAP